MKAGGAIWYIIAAVLVVAIAAYAVIATRKTRREQLQRSQERASAMMLALHQAAAESKAAVARNAARGSAAAADPPAAGSPAPAAAPAPAPATAKAVAPPAPPQPLALTRRARALTDPQRLLFLVLRTALPDHVVMPNLRIVDLLDLPADVAAIERDARVAALSRQRLDFVVCNSGLEPVAAIVLHDGGEAAAAADRVRIEALREFGVRYLRFRADSLPKPAEARSFILG
jgi:hypothetical protein